MHGSWVNIWRVFFYDRDLGDEFRFDDRDLGKCLDKHYYQRQKKVFECKI